MPGTTASVSAPGTSSIGLQRPAGPREGFDIVAPLLTDLAVTDKGAFYAGPSPSGHFVKLVHNAIEFGMVQAIAEGVEMLKGFDRDLDLPALFEHWTTAASSAAGWSS